VTDYIFEVDGHETTPTAFAKDIMNLLEVYSGVHGVNYFNESDHIYSIDRKALKRPAPPRLTIDGKTYELHEVIER
jgi:hypothetical protein